MNYLLEKSVFCQVPQNSGMEGGGTDAASRKSETNSPSGFPFYFVHAAFPSPREMEMSVSPTMTINAGTPSIASVSAR